MSTFILFWASLVSGTFSFPVHAANASAEPIYYLYSKVNGTVCPGPNCRSSDVVPVKSSSASQIISLQETCNAAVFDAFGNATVFWKQGKPEVLEIWSWCKTGKPTAYQLSDLMCPDRKAFKEYYYGNSVPVLNVQDEEGEIQTLVSAGATDFYLCSDGMFYR